MPQLATSNPYPPGGSPDELRREIAELMGVVQIRAQVISDSASIRDDAVVAYGLRCLVAEVRAALAAGAHLAETIKADRDRHRDGHLTHVDAREAS